MQPTTQVRLMAGSSTPLTTHNINQLNQTLLNQRFAGVSINKLYVQAVYKV